MKWRHLLLLLLIVALLPASALANDPGGNHDTYSWFVGTGFAVGPTVAMAPNGDTIAMIGSGAFKAGPNKFASGGGTYTLTQDGTVSVGSWSVTGIVGFVSYGGFSIDSISLFGGELKLGVSLSNGTDGVLIINCQLGNPPPGSSEGIKLILGQGGEFTEHVSGETVFTQP